MPGIVAAAVSMVVGGERREYLRESMHISCTVVIVAVSSVMLTFLLLDNEPVRCQKGVLSDNTAVSLREVADRPADRAAILSEGFPMGLLAEGQSWYLGVVDCVRLEKEGLLGKGGFVSLSLAAWRSFNDMVRRGNWKVMLGEYVRVVWRVMLRAYKAWPCRRGGGSWQCEPP